MTAPVIAPPCWPADATLLRDVFRAARAEGWRSGGDLVDRKFRDWEWRNGDKRVRIRISEGFDVGVMYITGENMGVSAHVYIAAYAVDLIVDSGWLPEHLHRRYRSGVADGRDDIRSGLRDTAESGGVPAHSAELLREPLRCARDYWLNVLADRAVELERPLEPLLDRRPWPKGRQRDLVVEAVREVLERG